MASAALAAARVGARAPALLGARALATAAVTPAASKVRVLAAAPSGGDALLLLCSLTLPIALVRPRAGRVRSVQVGRELEVCVRGMVGVRCMVVPCVVVLLAKLTTVARPRRLQDLPVGPGCRGPEAVPRHIRSGHECVRRVGGAQVLCVWLQATTAHTILRTCRAR